MDPPPPPPLPPSTTAATYSHLPPLPTSKLRLMCSYGGHIVPRPNNKSLCYAGGETRIVAVDRRTTTSTLSALTTHLSRVLYNNRPFTLKYQLPNEDLDSLISVTTDEDLQNMLEELDRIVSLPSPVPSRIRLFLFPSRPESVGSVLLDPKSETWFSDALKSTMIINRGFSDGSGLVGGLMGLDGMGNPDEELNNHSGGGGEGKSVPESMVLETCSSFGSTSSSVSMSNLPPIGVVHCDDGGGGAGFLDKKVKVASASSIDSDNGAANAVSYPKAGACQNRVPLSTLLDTSVSSDTHDAESIIYDPSSTIQMQRILKVSGHQLPHLPEQKYQQEMQYVHTAPHYIQQYPTGPYHVSSYYPMYNPYQPSQPYPIYLMPIRPTTQSYNTSGQGDTTDNSAGSFSRPPLHPQSVMMSSHASYKEVLVSQTTPELSQEFYRMAPPTTSKNQQLFVAPPETHHSSQSAVMASTATVSYDNEYDDDLAYAQIYKSQPSAPALPPMHQTMTKAATVLLSEATAQLRTDNFKHQTGTSQPQ